MKVEGVVFLFLTIIISAFANEYINEEADISEFPYLVSLRERSHNIPFCSGVILSKWHIITVAKCIDSKLINTDNIGVYLGSSSAVNTITPVYTIERINIHPDYTGEISMRSIYDNNLAIITVKEAIVFNTKQRKIELPLKNPKNKDIAITAGWGLNSYSLDNGPQDLKKSSMKILDSFQCSQLLPFIINDGQLCAYQSSGVGPGDVGGPLVNNGKLIGVLSYLRTSPKSDPGVYTNIYFYLDFIRSVVTL